MSVATLVAAIGRSVLGALALIGRIARFAADTVSHVVRPPFYSREFGNALVQIGWLSLPVVGLTALFTGGALALQIYAGGSRFNAEAVVPSIVAIGMVRELGPVLGGLMVAARVASSIAAEIGTMKVTEQIDALTTLSTNPMKYLTLPRVLAATLAVPLLVGVGDVIGIMGGFLVGVGRLDFGAATYLHNTIDFLENPLSTAIDTGNTGNIYPFSNRRKFESRLPEEEFNQQLADSLKHFLAIPEKNASCRLLDGHIDYEDFALYQARPYFNHFTYFTYDPDTPFGEQLEPNHNPLLLEPDTPIEALFLLEMPKNSDPTCFYDILDYFTDLNVSPVYSVVENPQLRNPRVTVSLLYSRKPAELVADFQRVSEAQTEAKVRKSLEQNVELPKLEVNLENEAKRVARRQGADEDDVLAILRRLGKL